MDVKVSVIVSVYNSGKYLRRTLDSILDQTFEETEIICVDDGSADNSLEILREYESKYSKIKVLRQLEKSDGAALARNLGIENAVGEYLSILDSDDFFEPDMIEKAYSKAKETNADMVIYDGYVFDENLNADKEVGYILHNEYIHDGEDVLETKNYEDVLFQLTLGAAWNCLFRHDFVRENNIKFQCFHHADDLGFVYLAFACAKRIAVVRDRLIHYRLNNSSSQAANIDKWPETSYLALEQFKSELIKRSSYEKFKASFAQCVMIYVDFYFKGMKDYKELEKLYNALKNKYFEKLDVYDITDDKFKNKYFAKLRYCIKNMSCGEYVYAKYNDLFPFDNDKTWKEKIGSSDKIIIYGAGDMGKEIFCKLIKDTKITGWCDKNYAYIGYPVLSPEIIPKTEYDYVIVAVAEKGLYKIIKSELVSNGVFENKICWIGEESNE
ncbi:MAG: glycosyltransferase [Oscillospiraceae bacterium]|nr:glycosyltransferase [Oscillospiraceae bacterium]